jgi:hypothetical protein
MPIEVNNAPAQVCGSAEVASYARKFVVPVPVAKAWAAFVEPGEREAWMMPSGRDQLTHPDTPVMEGFEPGELKIDAVEKHCRLSWLHRPAGLDGWYRTTVKFDEVHAGTQITLTRDGFGQTEDWCHYGANTARGWDEHVADLILYLETGVSGGRHWAFRSGLAATMLQSGSGVRITHVVPGGFAEHAGLRTGDVLVRLNGASVVHLTDIAFAGREHPPGAVIEVEYVRGGKLRRGRAPLSDWNYGGVRYIGHPGGYPTACLRQQ